MEEEPGDSSRPAEPFVPLVRFVRGAGLIVLTEPADTESGSEEMVIELPSDRQVGDHASTLRRLLEIAPPGEYRQRDLARSAGYPPATVFAMAEYLGGVLPPHLLSSERGADGMRLRLGAMAVQTVQATAEQEAAYRQRAGRERAEKRAAEQAALIDADAEKINLLDYSHALIRFGQDQIFLPLDEPGTRLAARVVDVISGLPGPEVKVGGKGGLISRVWTAMPIAERELFCDYPNDIFTTTGTETFRKMVNNVFEGFTGPRAMTQRTLSRDVYRLLFSSRRPEVEYSLEPLVDESGSQGLIYAFPRESHHASTPIRSEAQVTAQELITMAGNPELIIDHPSAIKLIDDLTSVDVKMALRARASDQISEDVVVHILREIARRSLGDDYRHYVARIDRTIGGGLYRRGVRQSGGRLAGGSTNYEVSPRAARQWVFSEPRGYQRG